MPSTSPVERISGPSTGSTSGNMLKGSTTSFTPTCGMVWRWSFRSLQLRAQHELRGDAGHRDIADLGHQRHGARGARVGFEHIDLVLADGVLDVHHAADLQLAADAQGVFLDGLDVFLRQRHRRNGARGIAGVDAGQFDVLHDGRHKGVGAVGQRVGFGLDGVVEEAVDQDGPLGGHVHRLGDVFPQHLLVVDDFHAASAEHEGRPHHHRIADARGDLPALPRSCWPCRIRASGCPSSPSSCGSGRGPRPGRSCRATCRESSRRRRRVPWRC